MNILALIVTSDSSPSGSKILDHSLSTSRFVTKVMAVGIIGDFDVRDSISV